MPLTGSGNGLDVVVLAKNAACGIENKKLFKSLDKHWLVAKNCAKNPD